MSDTEDTDERESLAQRHRKEKERIAGKKIRKFNKFNYCKNWIEMMMI